jgi:hypothetical protein
MMLTSKQEKALRELGGHGNTMNALVRKGLVTYHQKVEHGLFDGRQITFWYVRTETGKALLKKLEEEG